MRLASGGRQVPHTLNPGHLLVAAADLVGVTQDDTGTIEGGGDEVTVDLVSDLDALVAEPAGDLGDGDALCQRRGRVDVAQ
jgi:hypothetical protein